MSGERREEHVELCWSGAAEMGTADSASKTGTAWGIEDGHGVPCPYGGL